ncbi:MAG: PKD domain-containing protein [Saprospiraceae bacterium]
MTKKIEYTAITIIPQSNIIKNMKYIIITILLLFSVTFSFAQNADILSGCAPLSVSFTSPSQSTYFWNFKDGATSEDQNPNHNFIDPGTFVVELFVTEGGTKIGEIEITIFEDPIINLAATSDSGCSPFQVTFTDESIVGSGITITGYLWDFGDGNTSNQENPTHVFYNEGTFDITLQIETSSPSCNSTKVFEDFITVAGNIDAGFSLDKTVDCILPATFTITNETTDSDGYTYSWAFGNGSTSIDFDPGSITFDTKGIYTIVMTVNNGQGCEITLSRQVTVGPPTIMLDFPDTVCLGVSVFPSNTTTALSHNWSFGNNGFPQTSNARSPEVRFDQTGLQTITYSALMSNACKSDTFFTAFVEDPNADFTISPFTFCGDPANYVFTHPNSNHLDYTWTIERWIYVGDGKHIKIPHDRIEGGSSILNFEYDVADRDSFYIARPDTFIVTLDIITRNGCAAKDSALFIHRAPEAHALPDVSRGCAPLTVTFEDLSLSTEPIISWEWEFGDGTTASSTVSEDMTHTFDQPGEYWVNLTIENDVGCKHRADGIKIIVGEKISSEFTFSSKEICLYDSVSFEANNMDPRIDAYHFDTDEGRNGHCFKSTNTTHQFIHAPGVYPVTLEIEYNGCYNTITATDSIIVNGSKSRIKYMTNCIDPYTVMLQDSSVNASSSIWYIDGDTINMDSIPEDMFNYTFDTTGAYTVFLITDDDSPCSADTSQVTIYIKDIKADFDIPDKICAHEELIINASNSIDVDNTCNKGYNWHGISTRPRMISENNVTVAFPPGDFDIRLITEDVNGCKDTLDKIIESYGINSNFAIDKEKFCFPTTLSFDDQSTADTTIVGWEWDFGSTTQNPQNVLFAEGSVNSFPIQLIVSDVLGCKDTLTKFYDTYAPTTDITFTPGKVVCLGESIGFQATDFTSEGSFLNYQWDFGSMGTDTVQNPTIEVTESGITEVTLIITEDSTGCRNEYKQNIQGIIPPTASFVTDPVNTDGLCPPAIVNFLNTSTTDGQVGYLWDFGNGTAITGINVSSALQNGTNNISLIVNSIYGCSDTVGQSITLLGPSGDFVTDKDRVCKGEEIIFSLSDTTNVSDWEWDFGTGSTTMNVDNIPHAYDLSTQIGNTFASLVLKSKNGCDTTISKQIHFHDVVANFEYIQDTSEICNREIIFNNESKGASDYTWDFGNGDSSTDENVTYTYFDSGSYNVKLTIFDEVSECKDEATASIIITALNKAILPTVFSPNNDMINDNFDIIIPEVERECINVIKSKIYNRWGNLIYDNTLPNEGWNGKYDNGDDAPAEVYTYILEIEYTSGEIEIFKGTVTLIK